ncbi:MAG: histidine kinase dimerization/phospho-acceptor domain-containing protein, partial [Bacteroidota bacterium]
MSGLGLITVFLLYLLLLFGIAYAVESRKGKLNRFFNTPYNYALSLTVYCTAWTYFGSVGRAASEGLSFLPIYIGPLLLAPLWPFVMRKMVGICKEERITSVPDFISSRYGKSRSLGLIAASFLLIGVIPYISLQLKAIAAIFDLSTTTTPTSNLPFYRDNALLLTLVLALFTMVYGVRKLDANERHEGVIAAISFEAIFKLIAFLVVGVIICIYFFGGASGFSFADALNHPDLKGLWSFAATGINGGDWFWLTLASMCAVILLPRQFHVAVVENNRPEDIDRAAWLFPLYLLLINLFVLPIAAAGVLYFDTSASGVADMFVISLSMATDHSWLTPLAALGGFAAATGMVIMSTISLSLIISNNIILPYLLSFDRSAARETTDLSRPLLNIRRVLVVVVLLLAYGYYKWIAAKYSLVGIGLISFAAVSQFAPSVVAALYWKSATRRGVTIGLVAGFFLWAYTLALPTIATAVPALEGLIANGPGGVVWLRPEALFGYTGLSPVAHGIFWSLLANLVGLVVGSLSQQPDALQVSQADFFVDHEKLRGQRIDYETRNRRALTDDLERLLARFTGPSKARKFIRRQIGEAAFSERTPSTVAGPQLVTAVEQNLAGVVGAASAQVLLKGVTQEDPIKLEEVITILRQTQEAVRYGKKLEEKQQDLQRVTVQLRAANQQLRELDELKAEFISTVTHELRTPITSIKSLARILLDNADLSAEQRGAFLKIIVSESERLSRLVSQVLDVEKLESPHWVTGGEVVDLNDLTDKAILSLRQLAEMNGISLT